MPVSIGSRFDGLFCRSTRQLIARVESKPERLGSAIHYITKKQTRSSVTDADAFIKNRLNNRPRTQLGFKTLYELFTQ